MIAETNAGGLAILAVTIAVLVGAVVWIFRRANQRDKNGVTGTFWPQSSMGQLGLVALVLVVIAMLASFVSMSN